MERSETKYNGPDEKELVARLRQGQEWAYNLLVERFQTRLFRLAYGITLDREESLEIVQDVFVSVYKNIDSFRGDAGLAGWMRKITVNLSLNWRRKWKRRFRWHHHSIESENGSFVPEVEKEEQNPEADLKEKQMEGILMEKIEKLPEKVRAVFLLRTVEDLSYEEIARMLKIKPGTVKSRLFHARKYLMEALGDNLV